MQELSLVAVLLVGVACGLPSAPHAPHAPHHAPHAHPHAKLPSQNCSIAEVVESGEVCTPSLITVCDPVRLNVANIVDKEQCYSVTRTVCSSQEEVVENQVCTFNYQQKEEVASATGVTVEYTTPCVQQMVTVCSPGYKYGVNCKEVAQETCYNSPNQVPATEDRTLAYPEPVEACTQHDINLPRVECEEVVSEVCITVPEVKTKEIQQEICRTELGPPACEMVELTLPKESCIQIVYGYAHGYESHAPHQ